MHSLLHAYNADTSMAKLKNMCQSVLAKQMDI